ncbi:MAG: 23S rRNA (pseudouridine(1915)-N(3))-methyltransferase RlmH [Clostridia bacterium]|nr:23S rRNA (pseudouridine(1915)-N(3))-methyltransferase RlmH [Clostridia bacterium]
MIGISVVAVGRLKENFYEEACREYEKRLKGFCRLEIVELKEETGPKKLEKEADLILAAIPKGSRVVALCVEGRLLSSEKLAETIMDTALGGESRIAFLIGSSDGLSDRVKSAADDRISLSPMTFPHHLARVMLLEQIYRAFSIASGGKYHK